MRSAKVFQVVGLRQREFLPSNVIGSITISQIDYGYTKIRVEFGLL